MTSMKKVEITETLEQKIESNPNQFAMKSIIQLAVMSLEFSYALDNDGVIIRYEDPTMGMMIISIIEPLVELVNSGVEYYKTKFEGYAYFTMSVDNVKLYLPYIYAKYISKEERIKKINTLLY